MRELTQEEKRRYARQIAVGDIGREGQLRLLDSCVAIVGCGALGSMVAVLLAGAGVGTLHIADFDTVDISNLQRQLFFTTSDAGKPKSELLLRHIEALNPGVKVKVFTQLISATNINEFLQDVDFVVDATDNVASKAVLEKYCKERGLSYSMAGVSEFHGQVMTVSPGYPSMCELIEDSEDGFLPCSAGGVMGPVASLCASVQANEAIKYLTGAGTLLCGKLLTFDLLINEFRIFSLSR